jgi:hypothetical protein
MDLDDLMLQCLVLLGTSTDATAEPGVIATRLDLEHTTHHAYRVLVPMIGNALVLHLASFAK